MSPRTLSTAEARRAAVLEAAVGVFGQRGYYGSTTAQVATAAGISQPYIYRLFSDKQELFVAVVDYVSQEMIDALQTGVDAVPGGQPAEVLAAMETAYRRLTEDRGLVMLLMQANCAAGEPVIRDALRACYAKQVEFFRTSSGASDAEIRQLFGLNLLANVMTALHSDEVDAPWARVLDGRAERG